MRGVPLNSTEEFDYLNRRGMMRPDNNFSFKERLIEGLKSGGMQAANAIAQTGDLGAGIGAG